MPIAQSFQFVLSGAAQRLSDVYGGAPSADNPAADIPYRTIVLQNQSGARVMTIHNSALVSATVFSLKLDFTSTVPPLVIGSYDSGPIKLGELWVFGTAADKLGILAIPY